MLDTLARQIAALIVNAIKKQLTLQGHRMTGKLIDSVEDRVSATVTGVNIQILMEDYGVFVNNGVAASRIPYNPNKRSGKKTSKYIQGLERFARLKLGLSGKEALSAAFAIAKKQAAQGMPTKGSLRYSKTGQRTGAIQGALDDADKEITRLTEDYLETIIVEILI